MVVVMETLHQQPGCEPGAHLPCFCRGLLGQQDHFPRLKGELDRFPLPGAIVSRVSPALSLSVVSPGPLLSWAHG